MKSWPTTSIFVMLLTFAMAAAPIGAPAQSGVETIHGQIASIDDADALQVNDDRGFVDSVRLQPGAVINPKGTRLVPGMTVTISGVNRGSVFGANQIDIAGGTVSQVPPAPPRDVPPAELTGTLATPLDSKNAYVGRRLDERVLSRRIDRRRDAARHRQRRDARGSGTQRSNHAAF